MSSYGVSTGLINNRYEIKATLWTGGMGDVFRVFDRQTGRELALKVMEGDHPIPPPRLHRFKSEFRRTPDLVPDGAWEIYDTGLTEHGLFFMTLEVLASREASGGGSALEAGDREGLRALLASAGVLEGATLERVLGWLVGQAKAERAQAQVLDAEGQVIDTVTVGEASALADAARTPLERARYERGPVTMEQNGRQAFAVPLMLEGEVLGTLYLDGAGLNTAVAGEVASDMALAFAKDRAVRKAKEDTRHLEMLNALSRTISATMDFPQILQLVINQALEVTDAEQGAVFWGQDCLLALDNAGQPVPDLRVSQSVIKQVLDEARSVSILDTQEDERFATQASIMDLRLRSIMCVPLRAGQETRGVLYVSSQSVARTFGPHDLEVLEAIGAQVALALETAASYQTIRELNAGLERKVEERTRELRGTQAQLVQSEKMASLGQMVAGVAHELNNPLNFIHGNLKVLRQYARDLAELVALYDKKAAESEIANFKADIDFEYLLEDLNKVVDSCLKGAVRSQKIVEDLKLFSGHDEAELKEFDLKAGLESAVALVEGRFKPLVRFELALADLPRPLVYGKELNQAFLALLTNAAQAIPGEGVVTVKLEQDGDAAVVTVADTGVGITGENLLKVFDPFFTTRAVGEGTGLGLTTAYSVAKRHKGDLALASVVNEGTTATMRLPLAGLDAAG